MASQLLRRGLILAGPMLLVPAHAAAHAILIESSPAAGGRVAPGDATVVLRFNSRIDAGRSRLTLTHDGEAPLVLDAAAGETTALLQARASLSPGGYTLAWQVLAVDGHITRGRFTFTVDGD